MKTKWRVVQVGALLWAVVGATIALPAIVHANPDGRVIVATGSFVGPLAALTAARCVARRRDRGAGAFLLVSVLTPTYSALVLNVPALIAGLAFVTFPRRWRSRLSVP